MKWAFWLLIGLIDIKSFHQIFIQDSTQTWDNITKAYGGHCYEAEVERLEEVPVLPEGEEDGPTAEEDAEEANCAGDREEVLGEAHLLLFLLVLSVKCLVDGC